MPTRRSPGQRAGLTRDRVLAAARATLMDGGVDALTMRALAERLGVHPNALYSHVASKSALVDAVLDDVLADVETPDASTADPNAGLHALLDSTFEVLLAHRDLVPLFVARQGARGHNAQHLGEIMLALLRAEGVTGERAREARRALIVYTIGFAAFAAHPPLEASQGAMRPRTELVANFRLGLGWLIAGIAGSSACAQPRRRARRDY